MHPSSMKNMERVKAKHLQHIDRNSKILDVGGRGRKYDRSYGKLLSYKTTLSFDTIQGVTEILEPSEYRIADIVDGPGVTDVMPAPYSLPFRDDYFDLVLSGQTLEHVPNPFNLVAEMKRVMKRGGRLVIIVPSAGPRHDQKDYWRFMDDAFEAIAEDCQLQIVDNWITENAPDQRSRKWRDNVFVGTK